jgi:hypothetical protein
VLIFYEYDASAEAAALAATLTTALPGHSPAAPPRAARMPGSVRPGTSSATCQLASITAVGGLHLTGVAARSWSSRLRDHSMSRSLLVCSAQVETPNGGYTRVRRTEGLLRSVIGAVVQGTRRRENPPWDVAMGFSGWSPEAVQFFKGLQADKTKAHWRAHKAFDETSVREPMAALLGELSGEFSPGRIARPYRDVRFRAGKSPYKTAACSASCGRVDGRLDVHHRRPVDCLQSVDFNPKPLARHDAGTVQADRVRPIRRTGAEHAGQRLAHVVLGMRAQLVAGRQVQPAEHHDLIARPQVLGTLRDLLIEADPRPGRAFALVRRIVEDLQGRLHPPDRHEAVARLHKNSLLVGRGHGPRGCPD